MATVAAQQPPLVAHRDQYYYVSVKDEERRRHAYLLGPYNTHEEALANVQRGNNLACDAIPRAHWYAFGTCSVSADKVIRTVFGH